MTLDTVPFGQHVCWCGKTYAPTSDGRWTHRTIFAHTPSDGLHEAVEPIAPTTGISSRCRSGTHNLCGGGLLGHNGPIECVCPCGHVQMFPGHPERDWKAATCDNQGAKKTARDGEGNTDPGLTGPTEVES